MRFFLDQDPALPGSDSAGTAGNARGYHGLQGGPSGAGPERQAGTIGDAGRELFAIPAGTAGNGRKPEPTGRPYLTDRDATRFWAKVKRGRGCWLWTAFCHPVGGYGVFSVRGLTYKAHRVAWQLTEGKRPPDDLVVMHECDNPPCVRPSHLRLGTIADNNRHTFSLGLGQHGESHSQAKLTEDDAIELRRQGATGASCGVLAARFGVTRKTAWMITRGRAWRHLLPAPQSGGGGR